MTSKCQICGEKFEALQSHVTNSKDHPTWQEYKNKYPDAQTVSKKVKERISKNHADVSGEDNPMYGKHHSKETREKISEAHKGQVMYYPSERPELMKEMSRRMSGENNPMYGKTGENNPNYGNRWDMDEETKQKISEAMKGKMKGKNNPAKRPEVRKKISEAHKGKKLSEEHKKKISDAENGKILSEETKQKIGKANKGKKRPDIEGDKNPMHDVDNSGEDNPNWQGGKSFEPYSPEWTEELKNKVRERDGYQCQFCGMTDEEHKALFNRKLSIHHMDGNKSNNSLNNLITLCKYCHIRWHNRPDT